ncbi:MAG TPA: bifunctional phosphopantothenoylcysteine decarboxylase/phosphopantothenate--cysteine ligase CoaBC, partial [Candidatus Eisenbacteria bacterium]|nr:bifunctional phosphopantothenoylcysteine decarboxylase/phosphopantothenate--cysteine ligase CoaBC [Candidatus Eisenbacteria bacterium]
MLRDRVVVVGVSGGIAAYKACELVRRLRDQGATVIAVLTPAACEFVTPLTFQALTGNPVVTTLWGDQRPRFDLPLESRERVRGHVEHVDVAEAADCVVIAPATADLMARLVHGEAPDALTTLALATPAPLVIAPAMDLRMWEHAATAANVRALRARGARFVGPDSGPLASGLSGPGRLAETAEIVAAVEQAVVARRSLAGVRVLVGAGRTEEPLDPVRVLTNRSSGRMGVALAEAARDRGADVTLVAGPLAVSAPHGVAVTPVTTAAEMGRAMRAAAEHAEVVIMAAAVADYRPARAAAQKLKRGEGPLTLTLEPTEDVLAAIGAARRAGQVLVGFALETQRGVENARRKLTAKNVDLVVLNSPRDGIGGDTNRVTLVESRSTLELPEWSKREVAEAILDRVLELRRMRAGKGRGAAPRLSLAGGPGAAARGAKGEQGAK